MKRYGFLTPCCQQAYGETLEQFGCQNPYTSHSLRGIQRISAENTDKEIASRFNISEELKKAIAERINAGLSVN